MKITIEFDYPDLKRDEPMTENVTRVVPNDVSEWSFDDVYWLAVNLFGTNVEEDNDGQCIIYTGVNP